MKRFLFALLLFPALAGAASDDAQTAKTLTGIVGALTAQQQYMNAVTDYCGGKYPNLRNMAVRTRRDWPQHYQQALANIPLAKKRIVSIVAAGGKDPDETRANLDRMLEANAKAATKTMMDRLKHGLDESTDCMRMLTGFSAGAELDLDVLYEDQMSLLKSLR